MVWAFPPERVPSALSTLHLVDPHAPSRSATDSSPSARFRSFACVSTSLPLYRSIRPLLCRAIAYIMSSTWTFAVPCSWSCSTALFLSSSDYFQPHASEGLPIDFCGPFTCSASRLPTSFSRLAPLRSVSSGKFASLKLTLPRVICQDACLPSRCQNLVRTTPACCALSDPHIIPSYYPECLLYLRSIFRRDYSTVRFHNSLLQESITCLSDRDLQQGQNFSSVIASA